MSNDEANAEAAQLPVPDPALKRLERFVGNWTLTGRTVGAGEDNIFGKTTFEWLPGGFFLQQRISLDFIGTQIESLELIAYDPETKTFPSTVLLEPVADATPVQVGGWR